MSGTISAALERVVFNYGKSQYAEVRNIISRRIERDVMSEVSFMAGAFRRGVVGIGAGNSSPMGKIGIAHEWALVSQSMGISREISAGRGITWPARTERYLNWKKANYKHHRWFFNKNTELKASLGSAKAWVQHFGPVSVTIQPLARPANFSDLKNDTHLGSIGKGPHIRTGVATISVRAMTNITPSMLPGIVSGQMGSYGNGWNNGLMKLLPRQTALRLGGREGKYRHTIEPFLTFFLTRAVPNALFLRVERSLAAKLNPASRRG